jgi:hypothetical protein
MMTDAEIAAMHVRMTEIFGSRDKHLLWHLVHYARTSQKFDATFYDREPLLDVALDKWWSNEFLCGRRLTKLLKNVAFSDGTSVHVSDIWTMNYMPDEGVSIKELNDANIEEAEAKIGLGGETARLMLRNTYKCRSAAEEDWFIRRWIAS